MFYTDTEALSFTINKQTSRPVCIMFLVRKLLLLCLRQNIEFKARHISGKLKPILCPVCSGQFQTAVAIQRYSPYNYSGTVSSPKLLQGITTLLKASLAESSKGIYKWAWKLFNEFSLLVFGKTVHPALSVSTTALFVDHLHSLNLSFNTINIYLSAIAYVH